MPCARMQRYPESPCTPLLPVLEEPATVHDLPPLDTDVTSGANAAKPYRGHHRRVSSREIFSYIANHGHESQVLDHGHPSSDIALTDLERGPYTKLDSPTTNTTFPPLDRTHTAFPSLSFTPTNTTYPRSLSRSATYTQHPSVHSSVYRTQSRSERSAVYWFLIGVAALLPPLSLLFGYGVFDPFLTWVRRGHLPDISRHKRVALVLAWVFMGVVVGAAIGVGIVFGELRR